MKALLLGSAVVIASGIDASEETTYQHRFSPKGFYRYHDETGYKYHTVGMGLQYHLDKDEGVNVKFSVITNPQEKTVLMETESTLIYKIGMQNGWTIYPIVSRRASTHNVTSVLYSTRYIHKKVVFAGVGGENRFFNNFVGRIEVQGFRDLYNATLYNKETDYWGTRFSNPYGARVKIGLTSLWSNDRSSFDIEAYYGKTFPKCYEEAGCELAVNWAF